ncbi:MAG: hypothetical protein ACLT9P_09665 [Evtepia gabavorous]
MNTIRCSIVEDLPPLYIDGALREETAQAGAGTPQRLPRLPGTSMRSWPMTPTLRPPPPTCRRSDRRAFQAFRRALEAAEASRWRCSPQLF